MYKDENEGVENFTLEYLYLERCLDYETHEETQDTEDDESRGIITIDIL